MNDSTQNPYDNFSTRPLWQKAALIAGAWPFLVLWRWLWQSHAGLPACVLVGCGDLSVMYLFWTEMSGRRKWLYAVSDIGALMNAMATIANGGHMPVSGEMGRHAANSLWIPASPSTHLYFLCDIHRGVSFGDFLIGATLLALLANWIAEITGALSSESKYSRRMTFGIG
jgi:hypothetical protein